MKNKKLIILFLVMTAGLMTLVSAHLGEDNYDHHCGMMDSVGMMTGAYGYGGMLFGWLFGILILVALILLIVWLIKQIQKK